MRRQTHVSLLQLYRKAISRRNASLQLRAFSFQLTNSLRKKTIGCCSSTRIRNTQGDNILGQSASLSLGSRILRDRSVTLTVITLSIFTKSVSIIAETVLIYDKILTRSGKVNISTRKHTTLFTKTKSDERRDLS